MRFKNLQTFLEKIFHQNPKIHNYKLKIKSLKVINYLDLI
ncbi:hypothetical protein Dfer_3268 [Dyadobacter fermentans DSM 18053]|uniref:Uncharacterized protein n=1 Tax=Dyadobacter fermentans (strain ATCC 700827 / DSM 18053 / CIP 107007 / KCTC 52180 / NS114) TaxID=471854 RepID=C6VRV9_DYAFD|nr:hypothetical protein Dfer_3268 [Dyadobacter fermentans DSM 18053]